MSEIRFIDSTTRDGVQSLWAMRLTTPEFLAVAPIMDTAGFKAIESPSGGPGSWHYAARFLKEDPWERFRLICGAITRTPMRMWMRSRGLHDFSSVPKPHALAKLWLSRWAHYGIRQVIFLEEENDFGNIPELVTHARSVGLGVVTPIMYSLSPVHTPEYYVGKAREAVAAGTDVIEIKDQGGLLTPDTTRSFVKAIQEGSAGRVDLEFQTHCTTGLGLLCTLEAIKLGITSVRSCLPPLAEGSSNPSTPSIIRNAAYAGHTTNLDAKALQAISEHFHYVARKEGLPIGAPLEYDASAYDHQVPGGVQGTLRWQLAQLKNEHRFDEVLAETARVRKDMGYPIMVTPASQFIVAQATMNVLGGEPYKTVCDEVIEKLVLKSAIQPPGTPDPGLMDRIMKLPRTHEILERKAVQPSLEEMRHELGADLSDDDFLFRTAASREYYDAVRGKPIRTDYPRGDKPLMTLLHELMQRKRSSIEIRKGDLRLSLRS